MPIANNPVARTMRITSSVIFCDPSDEPQERGSNMFPAYGPMTTPKAVPRTTSFKYSYNGMKR